jgi:hypothetical protein
VFPGSRAPDRISFSDTPAVNAESDKEGVFRIALPNVEYQALQFHAKGYGDVFSPILAGGTHCVSVLLQPQDGG